MITTFFWLRRGPEKSWQIHLLATVDTLCETTAPSNRPKPRRKHSSSQPWFSAAQVLLVSGGVSIYRETMETKKQSFMQTSNQIPSTWLRICQHLMVLDFTLELWVPDGTPWCVSGSLCLLGWGATADRHVLLIGHGEPTEGMCCNLDSDLLVVWCFLGGGNSNIFYFQPYVGTWSNFTNIFQMGSVETTNQTSYFGPLNLVTLWLMDSSLC